MCTQWMFAQFHIIFTHLLHWGLLYTERMFAVSHHFHKFTVLSSGCCIQSECLHSFTSFSPVYRTELWQGLLFTEPVFPYIPLFHIILTHLRHWALARIAVFPHTTLFHVIFKHIWNWAPASNTMYRMSVCTPYIVSHRFHAWSLMSGHRTADVCGPLVTSTPWLTPCHTVMSWLQDSYCLWAIGHNHSVTKISYVTLHHKVSLNVSDGYFHVLYFLKVNSMLFTVVKTIRQLVADLHVLNTVVQHTALWRKLTFNVEDFTLKLSLATINPSKFSAFIGWLFQI